jgi:hypothetical protein
LSQRLYFGGCGDFNGIIAGAPAVNVSTNNSLYHAWIVQHLLRPDGSRLFTDQELAPLHRVVVKACALMGDQQGEVIADPRRCQFDPAMSSIAYFEVVRSKPGAQVTEGFMRLYMLPGVHHCGGGP